MSNNRICEKVFLVCFFFLMSFGVLYAPDAYISSQDYGDFSEIDSTVYSLDIGVNFNSGETISSSEMNNKFNILKDLFEQILNNNRAELNIPDNISYISKSGQSPIVIFASEMGGNGDLQGLIGAKNKCSGNNSIITNLNNNGKVCDNVKAVLASSDTPFEQIFDESKGPFYDPKGNLISNTWSEFYNLNSLDSNRFGLYVNTIWIGDTANNCNDWSSDSSGISGNLIDLSLSSPISNTYTGQCSNWKPILCACE